MAGQPRCPPVCVRAVAIEEMAEHTLVIRGLGPVRFAGHPHDVGVVGGLTAATFPTEDGKVRPPDIMCVMMVGPSVISSNFDVFDVIAV